MQLHLPQWAGRWTWLAVQSKDLRLTLPPLPLCPQLFCLFTIHAHNIVPLKQGSGALAAACASRLRPAAARQAVPTGAGGACAAGQLRRQVIEGKVQPVLTMDASSLRHLPQLVIWRAPPSALPLPHARPRFSSTVRISKLPPKASPGRSKPSCWLARSCFDHVFKVLLLGRAWS